MAILQVFGGALKYFHTGKLRNEWTNKGKKWIPSYAELATVELNLGWGGFCLYSRFRQQRTLNNFGEKGTEDEVPRREYEETLKSRGEWRK